MFYHMSLSYWLILGISAALSGLAALLVRTQFSRGQAVALSSGLTGCEVAQRVLDDAGIRDVSIEEHQGFLSDHYNPATKTLALSPEVYSGITAASAGVAAHEVGHAIQHARGYAPMWLRSALVPVANLGQGLGPLLVMIGAGMGIAAHGVGHGLGYDIAIVGLALFVGAMCFTVITVPVEFNASARARERLVALGITRPGPEDDVVRGVLFAAGLTYVAAAVTSILWVLYYAMQLGLLGGSDRDR